MTIYYLCPGTPDTISGGTRKLYDHVAILKNRGFDATLIYTNDVGRIPFNIHDLIVVPEVYGDAIRDLIPRGIRRVVFVQNAYITDHCDGTVLVHSPETNHPYTTTPEIVAMLTESEHTTNLIRARFPDLPYPIIRTHSSGNGRNGQDAGFKYGEWPRERRIAYFGYKHELVNEKVFGSLDLPNGWDVECLSGNTDAHIAERLRTVAIFAAANTNEGMCAPTSEAMISGAVIVCWTGGGPDEYLQGRAVCAKQDDVDDLRWAIEATAAEIERDWREVADGTRADSDWFQSTYSRTAEIAEICQIMFKLH